MIPTLIQRLSYCVGSLALFGVAAALFIILATRTHADADAEIVGWCTLICLLMVALAVYLAYLGLH